MKKIDSLISHTKQNGQILVLSIILLMVSVTAVLLVFNIGQLNTEKTRLVNAADAAAYSGGVFFARNLNFIAYTNRAMIANHVAVGHFISYVSWLRYIEDSFDKLEKISQFIPHINHVTEYTAELLESANQSSENIAPVLIKSSERLNNIIQTAQLKSQYTMNGVLSISSLLDVKVMDKIAKSYHPSIRVNFKEDVEKIRPEWIRDQITNDMATILHYLKRYKPNNDGGSISKIITSEYLEFEPWIKGNRGWKIDAGALSLYKEGSTNHIMSGSETEWLASDQLFIEGLIGRKNKKHTIASGQANTREFLPEYSGVSSYYEKRSKNENKTLKITALATMSEVNEKAGINVKGTSINKLQAISRAEIYYQRPENGFIKIASESFANLYNPFWQVRLTKNVN